MHTINFNNASQSHDYIIRPDKTIANSVRKKSTRIKITQPSTIAQKKTFSINDKTVLSGKALFTALPTITLLNGLTVTDYSKDYNFADRMQQMTLNQAETIRDQVKKNPHEFPMPCMAITADKIKNSLQQLKQYFYLTALEKQILEQIEIELKDLTPRYPYQQSLILTYKYILYKSFLDFRFYLKSLSINIEDPIELQKVFFANQENDEIKDTLRYLSLSYTGKSISSVFFSVCTLSKIKNLPWYLLLNKSKCFLNELSKIYFSFGMTRDINSAIVALSSNEVLIPYVNKLDITFFNKTWCLPLWLVGCCLDEPLLIADGFYLGASSFFEHDLFHLSVKLMDLYSKQPLFAYITEQIKLIYQNKHCLKQIKFKAIELAIFFIFHETGLNHIEYKASIIDDIFIQQCDFLPLYSLPAEYAMVSNIDMKNSFKFLIELFAINKANTDFRKRLAIAEKNAITQHMLDAESGLIQRYYDINYNNPVFIAETINDILSNQALLIDNKFNPSRLISILYKYIENIQVMLNNKSLDYSVYLKQQNLNKKILYQLIEDQRSLDWLVCFSESDKTLTSSERCKTACQMVQKGLIICL